MPKLGIGLGLGRHGFLVTAGPAAKYLVTSSDFAPPVSTGVTITAQLTDASGNPVSTAGLVVTWSKSDAGGSFGSPTSTTDAHGVATVTFTTSTADVACTVTATDTNAMTGTSATIQTHGGSITPDAVIQALINGELDGGTVMVYTGTRPASTADAPSGVTALADLTLDTPSAPLANAIQQDKITLNILNGMVNVAGTPTWMRFMSVDQLHVYDCDLAASAGTNTVVPSVVAWTANQAITAITITAQG